MPLLQLDETFSPDVLEITEEIGGKAGILEYLRRVSPVLKKHILPGTHIPFENIIVGKLEEIIGKMGKTVEELIYRSTHPDDARAYIGGIENLGERDICKILKIGELEQEIQEMKKLLISPEEKQRQIEQRKQAKLEKREELEKKYSFIFTTINSFIDSYGSLEVLAYAINSMSINHLEGIIRVLDYHKKNIYQDEYSEDEEIQMYSDSRGGYLTDTDVSDFTSSFHDSGGVKKLDKEIRKFVDGKTREEIQIIMNELKTSDIPAYFSDYEDYYDEERWEEGLCTQDNINEKEEELRALKQENLGEVFLLSEKKLEEYISGNNLRGLNQTGLYVQEYLGENWNYGTMLEHPHISEKFIFSGRINNQSTSMTCQEGNVIAPYGKWAPVEKLIKLYDEIIKTGLLTDDISLQVEFASKGSDIYILQVRAFRKKEVAKWKIKGNGKHAHHIFGLTPEDGVLVSANERKIFGDVGHGFDPYKLQNTKLAVTNCIAPFDHELTEVAYYPDIAVFGGVDTDEPLLESDSTIRVWSDGKGYKIEEEK